MFSCILCLIGLHKWESDPSHKELIKETGIYLVFWSSGVQKGIRKCTRPGCAKTQKVMREGFVGVGGQAGKWKPLSPSRERHIDRLPVM
ncbi:MAG TPA: hypothetical protein VFT82_00585 [Candidatus Paceibacterota bacterium]|nr:hypothetical protein [Candidatus Paceibacterota bacterium]